MHDAVECGRAIRVLSAVNAFTRECLALEVIRFASGKSYLTIPNTYSTITVPASLRSGCCSPRRLVF